MTMDGSVAMLRPAVFKMSVASHYLGDISLNKLRGLIADGHIEAVHDGGRIFPTVQSCDEYLASLPRARLNHPHPKTPAKSTKAK